MILFVLSNHRVQTSCNLSCTTIISARLPLAYSRDSFVTCLVSNFPIVAFVSLNSASLVSTFYAKYTSSSCHGWVTFRNSISSSCNFYNCICNFLLFPDCTIHCIGVKPGFSSFIFTISTLACHISLCTTSTTSICSMPIHDFVVVSSKCVLFAIWCAICSVISLTSTFNCLVGSLFSNSSILDLYSATTVSILSASACACTTTFCTFSIMEASGSSRMSRSSEHNSATDLCMLTSSCFHFIANVAALQYLFFVLSCSYLSATFFARTSCSLSLNSLAICTCRVLNVSEGSSAKSSYAAPSCSPSYALGWYMLIGVTEMNLCRVPSRSLTVLCIVDVVATCNAWLTSVLSSVRCVSIVYLSASYAVVIVVIGFDILSQNLSVMFSKSSSCSTV